MQSPRHNIRVLTIALLLVTFTSALPLLAQKMPKGPPREGRKTGEVAFDFTLKDLDGKPHRLKDLRGRVVHVVFWATWCMPCIEEMPDLKQAYERYHERGFEILGVVVPMSQTPDGVRAFAQKQAVRYPILLDPGERARVSVRLPPAGAVPDGFVHVPAGRFLYGSAADDEWRRVFLLAAPLHRMETGAFLIARHETTIGEWIRFLEELPAEQREARMPRPGNWGMIRLTRLPGGRYQLQFERGHDRYRARSGEPIVYPRRDRRGRQDWLRFPVSGVSSADAEAYVAWLDRTGRVPGARLCTEVEWERAARGADDRRYPHGDVLAPDDANFIETYEEAGLDEVGSHPASESPFGLHDTVGNVFEITVRGAADRTAVVRGGAIGFDAMVDQIPNRVVAEPGFGGLYVGLRVCADPPP